MWEADWLPHTGSLGYRDPTCNLGVYLDQESTNNALQDDAHPIEPYWSRLCLILVTYFLAFKKLLSELLDNLLMISGSSEGSYIKSIEQMQNRICVFRTSIFLLIFGEGIIKLLFRLFRQLLLESRMCPNWGLNPQPWCVGRTVTSWPSWPGQ